MAAATLESLLTVPGASRSRISRILAKDADPLDQLWACPWKLLDTPDPWQRKVLSDPRSNWILNASRQSGKTTVVSAQCLWEAMCCGSFVLILSASEPQAFEFFERVISLYRKWPLVEAVDEPTKSELRLVNGGRILAKANNEATVRVYSSVGRLVIDEASRVPDTLYGAVTPMLAVSGGRKTLLSTPFGKRGFFYNSWTRGKNFRREEVPWTRCPRLTPQFIEGERAEHGDLWVQQEYECKFLDTVSGVFDVTAFADLIDHDMETLQW